jgi:hypothetical protein
MADVATWNKEAEEADRLLKEMQDSGAIPASEPPNSEGEGNTPEGIPAVEEPTQAPEVTPEPAKAVEPEAQKPEPTKPEDTVEYWKHRFEVIEGKYKAEVKDSQETVALRSENASLRQQIASLNEAVTTIQREMVTAKEATIRNVSNEEIEAFKADHPEVADQMYKELSNRDKQIADLQAQIREVKAQTGDIANRTILTAQERYFSDLTKLVPDWKTKNSDPVFVDSLNEIEPFSGETKHELLKKAHQRMDVERVARFFLDGSNGNASNGDSEAAQALADKEKEKQKRLHPDTTNKAGPSLEAGNKGKRMIPASEVNEFYKNSNKLMASDYAAYLKKEAEYKEASIEGRITG